MPFPPTYTNVWDITFPPDTQLASLGAQDFRNLENSIMQRMSLLSGTFANMPTPETVNATWGGAGFGLIYFSTDTSQLFQWNGSAWVDITSSFTNIGKSFYGSGTNASLTVNIPANTLTAGSIIDVWPHGGANTSVGGSSTFKVQINGTSIDTGVSFGTGGGAWFPHARAMCLVSGSSGQLVYSFSNDIQSGDDVVLIGSEAVIGVDTTAAIAFSVNVVQSAVNTQESLRLIVTV